jgi:O-antigen/teichoic acid export membrane protein
LDSPGSSSSFSTILRHAWILSVGNGVAGIFGLLSTALAARILGPVLFGGLSLTVSFAALIEGLVGFQSWQALVKFGASLSESPSDPRYARLLGLGLLCDLVGAVVGGIFAVFLAAWYSSFVGIDQSLYPYVLAFGASIVFRLSGTPTAILRLHGMFHWVSYHSVTVATAKAALMLLVWLGGGGAAAVFVVWLATDIASRLLLLAAAWAAVRANVSVGPVVRSISPRGFREFPGFGRFIATTNVHSSVKLAMKELDGPIVGFLLGPADAGMLRVAKAFGGALGKLSSPLYQAVYPELSREVGRVGAAGVGSISARFLRLGAAVSGIILLIYLALGKFALSRVFGPDYAGSYAPSVVYLIGVLVSVTTFPLHPLMLVLGRPDLSLRVLIVSTAVYLPTLVILTESYGVVGACAAFVVFYLCWTVLQLRYLRTVSNV